MSLITRSIPGLFGGISQQIPAMRHPTQCEEQRNFIATVAEGMRTRPGTQHIATLALTGANGASVQGSSGEAFGHFISRPGGALYCLVVVNGNLMVYDALTGAAQAVTFPNGKGYLSNTQPSTGFAAVTVADYTFLVNSAVKPAMGTGTSTINPPGLHYVNVRTAAAHVTYTVTLNGTAFPFSSGDAPTNRSIADGLMGAINGTTPDPLTGVPPGPTGFTASLVPDSNILRIVRTDGATFTCSVYDGWANTGLQLLSGGVSAYSDLPARFETGYTVTINGTADNNKDAYYVKWDGSRWAEAIQPGIQYQLDAASMPHQLWQAADGTWTFERVPSWGTRAVGDEDTNPEPSFVGQTVRDVFFFRNRLGILAGDAVVLSRAGSYFNFWASTATQVVDTDPIDLSASVDGVNYLTCVVPLNQDLLVWTDTRQQLVLVSGDVLSPENARLAPSTTFAADPRTRPVALGNKAVFAEALGKFSKLSLYRVSQDTVTNTADSLTGHAPRLVPASPRQIAVSTASRAFVVLPRGASSELLHFQYEADEQRDSMSQQAWSRVAFDTVCAVRPISARWVDGRLYLLLHYTAEGDSASGGRFSMEVMDFQLGATDVGLDYALCMDRRVRITAGVYDPVADVTTYTVPFWEPSGITYFACGEGSEPFPMTVVSSTFYFGGTRVALKGDLTGSDVWAGRRFKCVYTFTEACLKDQDGVPVMSAEMKLTHYMVRFEESSRAYAKVQANLRGSYTYPFGGRTLGLPGHGIGQMCLSSGDFRVPVGFKARDSAVSIETDAVLPLTVPYAEWVADVNMKASR